MLWILGIHNILGWDYIWELQMASKPHALHCVGLKMNNHTINNLLACLECFLGTPMFSGHASSSSKNSGLLNFLWIHSARRTGLWHGLDELIVSRGRRSKKVVLYPVQSSEDRKPPVVHLQASESSFHNRPYVRAQLNPPGGVDLCITILLLIPFMFHFNISGYYTVVFAFDSRSLRPRL